MLSCRKKQQIHHRGDHPPLSFIKNNKEIHQIKLQVVYFTEVFVRAEPLPLLSWWRGEMYLNMRFAYMK